ncbi:MAG: hypothetical protein BGO57_13000 [Sphingomonadales bacterium 63-6]|nr:MAG: hypothetical protein BGO57_13000 [Sphingomonadales bacterium 63-6]
MGEIFNGAGRAISTIMGLLMMAMGCVWILQGFNIAFLNSFMAGDLQWALWGALLALAGLIQAIWANTRATYYKRR